MFGELTNSLASHMKLSRGCAELQLLVDRHAVFVRLISTPARAYLDSGANGICPEFCSSCTMGELAEWLPFFRPSYPACPIAYGTVTCMSCVTGLICTRLAW